ncbi:uncharacterized protein LOC144608039 [Rhinoraja longicauda]
MAEERRLKLKRRRVGGGLRELSPRPPPGPCQEAGQSGSEQPGAEGKLLPATVSTWLDDNDMNETDYIWALLMKSMFPDMKGSDWKTISVPDLPLDSEKIPKYIEPVVTEAISVGGESFMWTPFPPSVALEGKSRPEPLHSHGTVTANKGELIDSTEIHAGGSRHPLSEKMQNKHALSSTDAAKYLVYPKENDNMQPKSHLVNVKSNDSCEADPVRFPAEHAVGKREDSYLVETWHVTGHRSADALLGPGTYLQRPRDQEPQQPTAMTMPIRKPSQEKVKQHKMLTGGTLCAEEDDASISVGECQVHSFSENSLCVTITNSDKGAITKGRSDEQMEAGLDLESCPMCLVPFPAGFTQLDVDSHLAKCLSESTEDVMW